MITVPMWGAVAAGLTIVLVLTWPAALTIGLRRLRNRYGEPVFRQLPNGRLRFTWGVPQALHRARNTLPETSTAPSGLLVTSEVDRLHGRRFD